MLKTMSFDLKPDKNELRILRLVTHIAKNVYNSALYYLEENYFNNEPPLTLKELKELLKTNPSYRLLEPYQSTIILDNLIKAMNNFRFSKDPNKHIPKYKDKMGYCYIQFGNFKIEDGPKKEFTLPLAYQMQNGRAFEREYTDKLLNTFIKESKLKGEISLKIKVPRPMAKKEIKQIRIMPKYDGEIFSIQYIYVDDTKIIIPPNKKTEEMAIDIGVTNLATGIITNNKAFILDGKHLKSVIRLTEMTIAKYNKKTGNKAKAKRAKLYNHYNNFAQNYLGVAVKKLYTIALENNVGKIIIGWNKGLKNGGLKKDINNDNKKRINQSLIRMPMAKFKDLIIYKSKYMGIDIIVIDEAYTSKASFYDEDPFEYTDFKGERIERGLYRRHTGEIINADVNAALNIYRKYIVERSLNRDKLNYLIGSGHPTPSRIRILDKV